MMKINKIKYNQEGIAHLWLIIVGLLVLVVFGFAIFKVIDNNKGDQIGSNEPIEDSINIDEDDSSASSLDDISASEQADD